MTNADSFTVLLNLVGGADGPSRLLDDMLRATFPGCPERVTETVDAVSRLIAAELPGFWWTCGYCALTNDASIYPIGASSASLGPDFRQGQSNHLLSHPTMGAVFDGGFHCDRAGGSVPLSMLHAFLQAKILIEKAQNV